MPVKINNLEMSVTIVDKENPFYNILINLKTHIDHQLFIHSILYNLCKFNSKDLIDIITPINNEYSDEEKFYFFN